MRSALLLILLLAVVRPCQGAESKRVTIRFLGGSMTPLEGLKVTLFLNTGDYTDDKNKPLTDGVTDKSGAAVFRLAPARYYIEISSKKELPYLDLPTGYEGHPWDYDRVIEVGADDEQEFDFPLAEACKLTLKAIDADTEEGLPGVVFVTENATGEIWGDSIRGDNLGAKRETDETQKTDAAGSFTRLVGPRPGFTYFAWPSPEGYKQVGSFEVEILSDVGTKTAEHVFKFKRNPPAASESKYRQQQD